MFETRIQAILKLCMLICATFCLVYICCLYSVLHMINCIKCTLLVVITVFNVCFAPPSRLSCGLFRGLSWINYMQALLHAKPVFVLGDLNCNLLKSSPEQKALIGISAERNLTQIIKDPPVTHSFPENVRESGVLNNLIMPFWNWYHLRKHRALLPRSYKHYNPS